MQAYCCCCFGAAFAEIGTQLLKVVREASILASSLHNPPPYRPAIREWFDARCVSDEPLPSGSSVNVHCSTIL